MSIERLLASGYAQQVQLLVQILPLVFQEDCFALKGGTAINLFVRDMPRLSIDIDLVYLTHEGRATALPRIVAALDRVADNLTRTLVGVGVTRSYQEKPDALRLVVRRGVVRIKIELSPVLRGTVLDPQIREICPTAQEHFGYVEAPVVSLPDLYGGKICAALDRQHPRDIFDVLLLQEAEGLTAEIRTATLVYLLSHPRPMEELLNPHEKDLSDVFRNEFHGMTLREVRLEELLGARARLRKELLGGLTWDDRALVTDFVEGAPGWNHSMFRGIEDLPALLWKAKNIKAMPPEKREASVRKIKELLAPPAQAP